MACAIRKQRMPLQTTFKFLANLSTPISYLYEISIPTPNSPLSALAPSIEKPFKFVLASSKTIARWFGVTCEDCPNDSIWGCYVTKNCWKVVIVALGAIFLFITFLMGIFFLGQIDDLLKYQRQLTEFEKAYPTLAKIMIFPLKRFHKMFIESYDKTIKSLTKKFGTKPWFKFVVIMPCKFLKGTWTIFQNVLQPTCFFTCNACGKTKKCIADTGFFQWATDKTLKKAGLRPDPKGDEKRAIKAKQKEKQTNLDRKKANKQEKKVELQVWKDERAGAKEAKLEAKASKRQAKIDAREAKREAINKAKEARNDAKLDALDDVEETKRKAKEATEEVRLEAIEAVEEAKRDTEEKFAKDKASKAPPSSPALPSPPFSPPPSPMVTPMVPPTTPTTTHAMVPSIMPTTPSTIIPQGMSPVTIIPPIVPPTMPPTSLGMISLAPPIMTNQQSLYGVDSRQQYVDPYATQRYGDAYNANLYEVYQPSTREEVQAQGHGTYNQEQYGIYGNDPSYVQQGVYGQDQYGQQAMEYINDTNVGSNMASAQQQYLHQEYPQQEYLQQYQQQYNGLQYYG